MSGRLLTSGSARGLLSRTMSEEISATASTTATGDSIQISSSSPSSSSLSSSRWASVFRWIPTSTDHIIDSEKRLLSLINWGGSSRPDFTCKSTEETEAWFIDSFEEWRKAKNLSSFILLVIPLVAMLLLSMLPRV